MEHLKITVPARFKFGEPERRLVEYGHVPDVIWSSNKSVRRRIYKLVQEHGVAADWVWTEMVTEGGRQYVGARNGKPVRLEVTT